jgi:hypothetical protein
VRLHPPFRPVLVPNPELQGIVSGNGNRLSLVAAQKDLNPIRNLTPANLLAPVNHPLPDCLIEIDVRKKIPTRSLLQMGLLQLNRHRNSRLIFEHSLRQSMLFVVSRQSSTVVENIIMEHMEHIKLSVQMRQEMMVEAFQMLQRFNIFRFRLLQKVFWS